VEVGDDGVELVLRHLIFEWRHEAFAVHDDALDFSVGGGRAVGQGLAGEDAVEVRRDFFEGQIVFFVAVRAGDVVDVLALGLLRGEMRLGVAAGQDRTSKSDDGNRGAG
jgi:hypothetical protein